MQSRLFEARPGDIQQALAATVARHRNLVEYDDPGIVQRRQALVDQIAVLLKRISTISDLATSNGRRRP